MCPGLRMFQQNNDPKYASKLIRKSPTRQNDGLWNNLAKIPHMNHSEKLHEQYTHETQKHCATEEIMHGGAVNNVSKLTIIQRAI